MEMTDPVDFHSKGGEVQSDVMLAEKVDWEQLRSKCLLMLRATPMQKGTLSVRPRPGFIDRARRCGHVFDPHGFGVEKRLH